MENFIEFEYKTQILEHHLDCFGHVNNARYLDLYEEARWDFITENGYGLKEVQVNKKGPIVLDVTCRYKREIVNRETITIKSRALESKKKIMKTGFNFAYLDEATKRMIRRKILRITVLIIYHLVYIAK